ncbi:MAG: hypothetical protein HRT74_08490 [Flavobacteriales bacterium]|nr:hypothetical protein [Flavobacteriales bacterium]
MNQAIKHIAFVFIALSVAFLCGFANEASAEKASRIKVDYDLGILLMPNWNAPVTYAVIGLHEGNMINRQYITEKEFILIASGNMRSKANLEKTDMFFKYGVDHCGVEYDAELENHIIDCSVLNNLWKVRYKVYPGDPIPQEGEATVEDGATTGRVGWSTNLNGPSEYQLGRLQQLGIKRLNDFFIGKEAFDLIKAVNDPSWISSYK